MTENNKPEWFEIAENDGHAVPHKRSKVLPLTAVLTVALLLGIGAVVGLVQEESPASALDSSTVQTAPVNNSATSTTVAQASHSPTATRVANSAVTTAVTATTGLQNPAIAQLPTKTEDDDQEGPSRNGHNNHEGDHEEENDDEGEND